MRLEVRCCCAPNKLLGWIDVEAERVREGAWIVFALPPAWHPGDPIGHVREWGRLALPVARMIGPDVPRTWLALKSRETPLAVLRRLSAFTENPDG